MVNGDDILVFSAHSSWESTCDKTVFLSGIRDRREYECFFEPGVVITRGDKKNKQILSSGIESVIDLLNAHPVRKCYAEFENTHTYSGILISDDQELGLYSSRRNLISEIHIEENKNRLIVDKAENSIGSLVKAVAKLLNVRALDPSRMYGYVLQLSYSDGSVRNYYIKCFDGSDFPDRCAVDGFDFTTEEFMSVKSNEDGSVSFANGYRIPGHLLFYRSHRQVVIDYDPSVVYQKEGITIRSMYRLPLKEFKGHFIFEQYRGFADEIFGPNMPCINEEGQKISDIELYSINRQEKFRDASCVCLAPSGKYGFLKDDGTWLIPPIYDRVDPSPEGCVKAIRRVDGKETTFLITGGGIEMLFPFEFDVDLFTNGLCPFNAGTWPGPVPDSGHYYDFDLIPGKWGFVNTDGAVVVDPQYVYAVGLDNGGGDYSVVARLVDGKLLWGMIDTTGEEVISCKYPGLYCDGGDALAFQVEEDGLWGLMDFGENVIVEPLFEYIEKYDPKHELIAAGDGGYEQGVYSVPLGRMITSTDYDNIEFGDRMISCEIQYTCKERYFDYTGKELPFDEYEDVYESGDVLIARRNGKTGVLDWDGNILVPFVLDRGFDFSREYYQKGYIISGARGEKGLFKTNGDVILPPIYSEIKLHGRFAIASERTIGNWCIKDSLFTIDGSLLMEGAYRNMRFEEDDVLSADTPLGECHFRITASQEEIFPGRAVCSFRMYFSVSEENIDNLFIKYTVIRH